MNQIKAAQYVRMSTDHQDLSPTFQREAIAVWAALNGYDVVETYQDDGISGLRMANRPEMKRLLSDVLAVNCAFSAVLVYDVSRWGRFQDPDESAYYEYHCRSNGVKVIYVSEPFGHDISPLQTLVKNMKRAMAAEYSRELGVKCQAGQAQAARAGFHMGSLPCLGFRRQAVRKDGAAVRPLAHGDPRIPQVERIKWVHAAPSELALVRRIFRLYADSDYSVTAITRLLRSENRRSCKGLPFTTSMIRSLLSTEAVIGVFVWHKSHVAGAKRIEIPAPDQVRVLGSTEPFISKALWNRTQARLAVRKPQIRSREEMLADLRAALRDRPRITAEEFSAYGCATRNTYRRHFGSGEAALQLAGRDPAGLTVATSERRARSHAIASAILSDIQAFAAASGVAVIKALRSRTLQVHGLTIQLQVVWAVGGKGSKLWHMRRRRTPDVDYVLLARMESDQCVRDFVPLTREGYRLYPQWADQARSPKGLTALTSADELLGWLRNLRTCEADTEAPWKRAVKSAGNSRSKIEKKLST